MLYATVREDSKNDGTEAHVMPLTSTASLPADITISDADYPIQVLHQDDDRKVCPECDGTNLNEDKTRCWDCDGGPG